MASVAGEAAAGELSRAADGAARVGLQQAAGQSAARPVAHAVPSAGPVGSVLESTAAAAASSASDGGAASAPSSPPSDVAPSPQVQDALRSIRAERVASRHQDPFAVRIRADGEVDTSDSPLARPSRPLPQRRTADRAGDASAAEATEAGRLTVAQLTELHALRHSDPAQFTAARLAERFGLPVDTAAAIIAHTNTFVISYSRGVDPQPMALPAGAPPSQLRPVPEHVRDV